MKILRKFFVAASLSGLAGLSSASGYSGLVILGDSLSDAGNVALVVGADPGQVITGNGYIPDRPYASGQFSNGNVWAVGFAASLGFASAGQPSLLGGGDYAFGGARVATDGAGLAPSLQTQANMFLGAYGGAAPGSALYVVQGGGNDARDALVAAAGSATPGAVITAAATAYATATGNIVDQLQAAGAQHIIVWDVPNLGAAPAVTALGADAAYLGGQISLAMNAALSQRMAFESGVGIFDVYGLLNSVVADPAGHGLINATDACGAVPGCVPSTYLFWDGIHPTSAGHALLEQGMLAAAVPEPGSSAMILCGLLVLGWRIYATRSGST